MAALPPVRRVRWSKTYRLVASRYPPISLFERIADPFEWEELAALESLTNDRLRDELGEIALVPPDERISGPGASPIMAAFTHVGFASRFSAGRYGVYYANDRLEGAIREVAHHREAFLRRTSEPACTYEVRAYVGSIDCRMHDVRGGYAKVHSATSYVDSQRLGAAVRETGSNGIVFDGVRLPGSANVAVFRPKALAARPGAPHVVQGPHLELGWNGSRIDRYIVIGQPAWQPLPPVVRRRG
jgi:hypothetical protein